MEPFYYMAAAWLIITNLTAILLTVHDKHAAKKHQWRVPERTLLLVAALSGCVVMYLTMHLIRHKTKKPKFMIGIPVIFFLELAACAAVWYFFFR